MFEYICLKCGKIVLPTVTSGNMISNDVCSCDHGTDSPYHYNYSINIPDTDTQILQKLDLIIELLRNLKKDS
jgi:hypothetical protein